MGNFVRAAAAAAVGTLILGGMATPAHAEVWDCVARVNVKYNFGTTNCNSGFGTYRVAAKCNSAHYPYTRTIVGPWVTKTSGQVGPPSTAYGEPQGCHVVDAWTQVA